MIRSLGLLYNYGCLTRPSFAVTNLQRLCSSAGTGMTKPQGKQIPVEKDNRTFEEQRQDLVKNLEKNCGKECESQKSKQQQPQQHVQQQQQQHGQQIKHTADNHEKQLSTGEWSKELNQWIDEMDKLWSHDWNRAWRNMFSLVPMIESDLDPISTFGVFGTPRYIPSILSHMDHQMQMLRRNMDQLIPDFRPELMEMAARGLPNAVIPMGGLGDTQLDYLKDAYEPGEDGQLRFKLRFDLRGFGPEDVHVESDKNRLTVHAKKSEKKDGMSRLSEYCRTVYLPDKVDDEKFTSHLSKDGILTVEAPVKHGEVGPIKFGRDHQLGIKPKPSTGQLAIKPIGKNGLTVMEDGRIHLEVPVDAGFNSDDLQVSVVDKNVVVSGKHETEEDIGAPEKARHVREFNKSFPVPHPVDPLSLNAQLVDHTLLVEAPTLPKTS